MSYIASPELRECLIAARDGDNDAAKSLLKLYGYRQIAKEIRSGKPWSSKVRRAVRCLTAGVGSEWEITHLDGSIENDLMQPPPPPGTVRDGRNNFNG
jgi:hypothetical protein